MERQHNIRRAAIIYSEEFKRKVCEEYVSNRVSKMDLLRKYDIRFKSAIVTWLRKFGYTTEARFVPACEPDSTFMSKPKSADELHELEQQIRDLRKQLDDANLKVIVYDKLIEVAERDLKISIRKKANTKQSGK